MNYLLSLFFFSNALPLPIVVLSVVLSTETNEKKMYVIKLTEGKDFTISPGKPLSELLETFRLPGSVPPEQRRDTHGVRSVDLRPQWVRERVTTEDDNESLEGATFLLVAVSQMKEFSFHRLARCMAEHGARYATLRDGLAFQPAFDQFCRMESRNVTFLHWMLAQWERGGIHRDSAYRRDYYARNRIGPCYVRNRAHGPKSYMPYERERFRRWHIDRRYYRPAFERDQLKRGVHDFLNIFTFSMLGALGGSSFITLQRRVYCDKGNLFFMNKTDWVLRTKHRGVEQVNFHLGVIPKTK